MRSSVCSQWLCVVWLLMLHNACQLTVWRTPLCTRSIFRCECRWKVDQVTDLKVSQTGNHVVALCRERRLATLNLDSGTCWYADDGQKATAMALSRDGRYAVLSLKGGCSSLWDLALGKQLHMYYGTTQQRYVVRSCFGGRGAFVLAVVAGAHIAKRVLTCWRCALLQTRHSWQADRRTVVCTCTTDTVPRCWQPWRAMQPWSTMSVGAPRTAACWLAAATMAQCDCGPHPRPAPCPGTPLPRLLGSAPVMGKQPQLLQLKHQQQGRVWEQGQVVERGRITLTAAGGQRARMGRVLLRRCCYVVKPGKRKRGELCMTEAKAKVLNNITLAAAKRFARFSFFHAWAHAQAYRGAYAHTSTR